MGWISRKIRLLITRMRNGRRIFPETLNMTTSLNTTTSLNMTTTETIATGQPSDIILTDIEDANFQELSDHHNCDEISTPANEERSELTLAATGDESKLTVKRDISFEKDVTRIEKGICDICSLVAVTKTINENVEICNCCMMNNVDITAEGNTFICQRCEDEIIDYYGLLNILIKEEWQKVFQDHVVISRCRICGFKHGGYTAVRRHLITHFNDYDIIRYCWRCQEMINKLSNITIPDAGDATSTVFTSQQLIGKVSLQDVKIGLPLDLAIVICGKCRKHFDYLIPQIQKMVEFHLEVITGKYYYYCRVCCRKEKSKRVIEKHAVEHIQYGETFCSSCQMMSEDPSPTKLFPLPGMVETEQIQTDSYEIDIAQISHRHGETQRSEGCVNLVAGESVTDTDIGIFDTVVNCLTKSDFEGDKEIYQQILDSEWRLLYHTPAEMPSNQSPTVEGSSSTESFSSDCSQQTCSSTESFSSDCSQQTCSGF